MRIFFFFIQQITIYRCVKTIRNVEFETDHQLFNDMHPLTKFLYIHKTLSFRQSHTHSGRPYVGQTIDDNNVSKSQNEIGEQKIIQNEKKKM